ncbi:MAG: YqiA/YcfP family alpha/beta fold hydrolase [Rikenellaceae bacterium]
MKKILYIHGLKRGDSNAESRTATTLRNALDSHTYSVVAPTFSSNGKEALTLVRRIICDEQIDIVVGSSLGGFVALCLRGVPKIVINPCVRADVELAKLGRSDIASSYTNLIDNLWAGINQEEQERTIGVFSDNDELFSYREEFLRHYPQVVDIEDGHRISQQNIYSAVKPMIEKFASNYSKLRYGNHKFIDISKIDPAETLAKFKSKFPITWQKLGELD